MEVASALRRVRIAGTVLFLSLSAAGASADPPRPDALKMRNAPRASSALATPSQPQPAPAISAEPAPAQPAAPAHTNPVAVSKAVKEASDALELCYALARRADPSLAASVTVRATVRADASLELRAQTASLGNGYFTRCVERKHGPLVTVSELPEATADTRTIVVGAKTAAP